MRNLARRLIVLAPAALFLFAVTTARAAEKKFIDSDDAKEKNEPQKFLPDGFSAPQCAQWKITAANSQPSIP